MELGLIPILSLDFSLVLQNFNKPLGESSTSVSSSHSPIIAQLCQLVSVLNINRHLVHEIMDNKNSSTFEVAL